MTGVKVAGGGSAFAVSFGHVSPPARHAARRSIARLRPLRRGPPCHDRRTSGRRPALGRPRRCPRGSPQCLLIARAGARSGATARAPPRRRRRCSASCAGRAIAGSIPTTTTPTGSTPRRRRSAVGATRSARSGISPSPRPPRGMRSRSTGRVDPRSLHVTLTLAREPFDIPGVLVSLATSSNPVPVLRALEPPFYHYRRLVWRADLPPARRRLVACRAARHSARTQARHGVPRRAEAAVRLLTLLGDLTDSSAVNRAVEGDTA